MVVSDKLTSIIREHIINAREAKTHPAKLLVLGKLLENLFDKTLEDIIPGVEKKLKSRVLGVRGSADLVFSTVIFEIKVDFNRELDDAKKQLKKYFRRII